MAGAAWRSVDGSPCRWWQEDTDQWPAAAQSRAKGRHGTKWAQCGDLLLTCGSMEVSMSKLIIIPVAIGRLQNIDLNL